MSRFFITLEQAVKFVINCLDKMKEGEIFVPKMNSIYIEKLIKIINPKSKIKIIGKNQVKKFTKLYFPQMRSNLIYDNGNYYTIYSENLSKVKKQRKITSKFNYSSNLEKSLDPKKIAN